MHFSTRVQIFVRQRMVLAGALSSLMTLVWLIALVHPVHAHEVRPAIADVTVTKQRIEATISLNGEGLLAGVDLGEVFINDVEIEADDYDRLRGLTDDELAAQFEAAWPEIRQQIITQVGDENLLLDLNQVEITAEPNFELPRDTNISVSSPLPAGDTPVVFGWESAYGPLIVREVVSDGASEAPYTGYLIPGALSDPLPRRSAAPFSAFQTAVTTGIDALIRGGLAQILFVLGLVFYVNRWRPPLAHYGLFAAGHIATFALASLGSVTVPAALLTPLIALSIIFVAIENIVSGGESRLRVPMVFVFGLVHGFALAALFGPSGGMAAISGFAVGVNLAMLAVLAVGFLMVGIGIGRKSWYRAYVATPASALIALAGIWWLIARAFLA